MSVASTIKFAIDLIRKHGHATNEDCHAWGGRQGYCVGMSIILGSEAEGKSFAQATKDTPCEQGYIWHDMGVGNLLTGYADWREARRWVAWAWGIPRHQEPSDFGEDAAVTPNQYAKKHGIDPIPYLENALAMCQDLPVPHPELKPLDCWWRCEEGCGNLIHDPDGPCVDCDAKWQAARGIKVVNA